MPKVIFHDENGKVLAAPGVQILPPWCVLESTKFAGRFYFFNRDTSESAWSLDASVIGMKLVDEKPRHESLDPDQKGAGLIGRQAGSDIDLPISLDKVRQDGHRNHLPLPPPLPTQARQNGHRNPSIYPSAGAMRASLRKRLSFEKLPSVGCKKPVDRGLREVLKVSSLPARDSFDTAEAFLPTSAEKFPFHVESGLGQGGYGVVVQIKHHVLKDRKFAMKVVSKEKLRRRRDRQRLALELKIVNDIETCPFTQTFIDAFETNNSVFIVMELQAGGDLFYHLMDRISTRGTAFSEMETRVVLAELTLALTHVHEQGYIHRDVKVENVMLDASGHVKLIDFGLAVEMIEEVMPMSPTGSLIYMAPEMVEDHTGGRHTDWWAVGILAYELLTGSSPWINVNDKQALKVEIKTREILAPAGLSSFASSFFHALVCRDVRSRLGTASDSELRNAEFFSKIDWEKTAALKSEPAFVPSECSVCPEEVACAMEKYLELSRNSGSGPSLCSMGLRAVKKFPRFVDES